MPRRKEYVYIVFDYHGEKELGSFASFTMDTPAKMRDYLVRCGDIPNDALVRSAEEAEATRPAWAKRR